MELFSVSKQKYEEIVKDNKYAYNETWFHEINREKVDELYYLLFKSKKYKFHIIAGVCDQVMKIPYSAPFSILERRNDDVHLEDIEVALHLLQEFAKGHFVNEIVFRLPPAFYDENYINKFQNCLIRLGYSIEAWDLNYQYVIRDIMYLDSKLKRNARKNLHVTENYSYRMEYCKEEEQKKLAYEVTVANRQHKGYPLRMTWEQVRETIQYMTHDFFLLYINTDVVAAAVIFRVTSEIYQVIYWGDTPGYSEYRPMNYLSYHLYKYYCEKGIKVLDIGPSTEDSVPNYGLCDFKESIGCDVSSKLTYKKVLKGMD